MAADSENVDDLSEPKHEIVGYDDLCSCCLAAGALVNMLQKIEHGGKMENYYDLIRKCYDSQLLSLENPSNKYYICEICIARLTDSYSFKLQVIEAQKTLQDFFKVQETTQGLTSRRSDSSTKLSDYLAVTQTVLKTESSDSDDGDDGDPFGDDADLSDYKPPSPPTPKSTKRTKSKENTPQRPKPIQIIIPKSQPAKSKRTSVSTRASPLKPQPSKPAAKQPAKRPASSSAPPAAKQSKPRVPQTKAETRLRLGSEQYQLMQVHNAMQLENLQCLVCSKIFKNRPTLAAHMNEHFVNYTCEKCGKNYALRESFKRHMSDHTVGTFACSDCDRVFQTKTQRKNHQRSHFMYYKCNECPKRYRWMYQVHKHRRDEHGRGSLYPCPECDKAYVTGSARNNHMRFWHEPRSRKSICKLCAKAFFNKYDLKHHMIVHTDVRNFICDTCSNAYKTKNSLIKHLVIHSGIKKFKCTDCDMACYENSTLQRHIRRKHKPKKL